jgi:[acyl-carrier-protein] S-malonyltransferase
MSLVFMFPGQSSADPQMIVRALSHGAAAHEVARRAVATLGTEVAARYFDPAGVPLATNRDVQVGVFLATQMHLAQLAEDGIDAETSLGLSLGEYSHLVHIGALTFEEALRLVDRRGAAYDTSPPGIMVTVLAAERDEVEQVIAAARPRGLVVISNFNTPTQHVIAGEAAAVTWAAERLEEDFSAHTVVIERRVPMHTPLLAGVAGQFRPALDRAAWIEDRSPAHAARAYWPNVSATPMLRPTRSDFIGQLVAHVTSPVLWRTSVEWVAANHPAATFVEVGPGGVLSNMLGRRWLAARHARTDAPAGSDAATRLTTLEALRAAC